MSSNKSLKILVIPLNSTGHINACHGLCEEFRDCGHQVTFLLDGEWAGRLVKFGFNEFFLERPPMPPVKNDQGETMEFWQAFISNNADLYKLSPVGQMNQLIPKIFEVMFEEQKKVENQYEKAIAQIQPDLIIIDSYVSCSSVVNSGIPWVYLYSAAPQMMVGDKRVPPAFSGLPYNGDKTEWNKFIAEEEKSLAEIKKKINDFNLSKGGQPLNNRLHPLSPYLNVYMWPNELIYDEYKEADVFEKKRIISVESLMRNLPDQTFEIPATLQNKPGKLVFFSMGSFGCANKNLMIRLLNILAKSPNRFIISRGPFNLKFPGDHMWGEGFLPQTAILKMVDLVITHAGNNTLTETFYYGKKMLILPTFFDQFDNARRMVECGLSLSLNPFYCQEAELLEAIETLLADDQLTKKMAQIGERIRDSKDKKKVVKIIENFLN